MIRIINIILAITASVFLVGVYAQKSVAEGTAEQVRALNRAIEEKRERISILEADWAYLNQPAHIQALVNQHSEVLGMHSARATQYARFEDLPLRPEMRLDTDALDALFQSVEQGEDPIGSLLEDLL